MTTTVEELYQEHVKLLSVQEKLQLITLITEQLARVFDVEPPPPSIKQKNGETALEGSGSSEKNPEHRKGSPQAILQWTETLSADEAELMFTATKEARPIDWEMWEQ
ncbi:MAG: hypothetical protein H6631_14420 [Anaerolineaceae bacterium]|nr:hypothetical protein [Anaerolineaceae bacterium]